MRYTGIAKNTWASNIRNMDVDWEWGIDFDRLRVERLNRAKSMLKKSEMGDCSAWVALASHGEIGGGAIHHDAALDQRVHEPLQHEVPTARLLIFAMHKDSTLHGVRSAEIQDLNGQSVLADLKPAGRFMAVDGPDDRR